MSSGRTQMAPSWELRSISGRGDAPAEQPLVASAARSAAAPSRRDVFTDASYAHLLAVERRVELRSAGWQLIAERRFLLISREPF
jgi:hypothetical protein